MDPKLSFEPFSGALLLRPLKRLPILFTWGLLPVFLGIAAAVAAFEHTLSGPGIPPLTPFQYQLGIESGESYPAIPLMRDLASLLLIATVPLTIVCLQRQWRYIADCVPQLEESGALTWRQAPGEMGFLDRLVARRGLFDGGTDCRKRMHLVLGRLSKGNRLHSFLSALLALAAATALSFYLHESHAFLALAPPGSASEQTAWASKTYANWWASWEHPIGAVLYGVFLTLGVYVILAQNYVSMKAVRILLAAQLFGNFHVNWLNIDGGYGWEPFRRVFRTAYLSMALRATQIVLLIVFLSLHNLAVVIAIGAIWLVFLCLYIVYPYWYLRNKVRSMKEEQLEKLAAKFVELDLAIDAPSHTSRHFVEEIGRIQEATINPMQLTRLQSSSFAVLILLPICLTVAQIVS
jgi:hypothetical protein